MPEYYKPFRNCHSVFSGHDIVDNAIVASMEEMYNTVLVRGPNRVLPKMNVQSGGAGRSWDWGKGWVSEPSHEGIPFHPNIKKSSRKLAVAVEPNALSSHRRMACLMSNMALALRPMYRGELKILGKNIWPWDLIAVSDDQNGMYGMIEADRVTHEFTSGTGWITTIQPHAYAHVNNPWALYQSTYYTDWAGVLETGLDILFWVTVAISVLTGAGMVGAGMVAGRSAATKLAGEWIAKRLVRKAVARGVAKGLAEQQAKQFVKRYAKNFFFRNIANAKGIRGRALGAAVARNWFPAAVHVGKTLGYMGIITEGLNAAAPLVFDQYAKFQVSNTYFPLDVRFLSLKGNPHTAGLDLTGDEIMTFKEKMDGSWSQITKGIHEALFEAFEDDVIIEPRGYLDLEANSSQGSDE